MKFCTLFSGSSGNCTYIEYENTRILIDAGKNMTAIKAALAQIDTSLECIDAILLTHGHADHISALKVLTRRYGVPIMGTFGTLERVLATCDEIMPDRLTLIEEQATYNIGQLEVTTFKTPHDAEGSIGFSIMGDSRLTIATDIGYVTDEIYEFMKQSKFVIIESNYAEEMLEKSKYSERLKRRIRGKNGHLSNWDCAETVCRLVSDGVIHFMLAHVSENNNRQKKALLDTMEAVVMMKDRPAGITVDFAPRHKASKMFKI